MTMWSMTKKMMMMTKTKNISILTADELFPEKMGIIYKQKKKRITNE